MDGHPDTLLAQALGWIDGESKGVVPSIRVATTYARNPALAADEGVWYSRPDNPIYHQPEALIARLEGGAAAMVTASGMASLALIFQALDAGDHVVVPDMPYGGLIRFPTMAAHRWGIDSTVYKTGDLESLGGSIVAGRTKVVWVENPSNPELVVTDLAVAARLAHDAGAHLVVDSTLASPLVCRPLEHGADVVLHSATKYLNGHSDVVCGALVTKTEDAFWQRLSSMRMRSGAVLGPFETWLLVRGMRTLHVRMERASQNAMAVAEFLSSHPRVTQVFYPGLAGHGSHETAKRILSGFGAMVSFAVEGGAEAKRVWSSTKVFKNATSLGGVESLIEHRHFSDGFATPVPPEQLRLSVGIEDKGDLIADLDRALGGSAINRAPMPATQITQGMGWTGPTYGDVVLPVHMATTYERDPANYKQGLSYGRDHNPTFEQPEAVIACLEKGEACRIYSSGMAAAAALFQALAQGDHVVIQDVLYWGVRAFLKELPANWGMVIDWFPSGDLEALKAKLKPGATRLVWVESPANPAMTVTDIAAAAAIAHEAGALLVCDNTFATPLITRPIELGADIVMHSATKYLNGHSDVVAGALVTARDTDFWRRVAAVRHLAGAILGPFEAWLLMRGLRTLHLRVERASANALALARFLDDHDAVEEALYPGLENFAGYEIARRQMTGGFGGMLSVRIKGGEAVAKRVWAAFRLIKTATSLGGVESLVEHRASVEDASSTVAKDLLRISVGIEHIDDLIADMDRALAAAAG